MPSFAPNRAVGPVGGDQVVGEHVRRHAAVKVLDRRGDARVVLGERHQFRAVSHLAAQPAAFIQQDRFQSALRTISSIWLGAEPLGAGKSRGRIEYPALFGAAERLFADHRRNVFGDGVYRISDTQTAQYLQAAEVEVAGLWVYESRTALFDQAASQRLGGQAWRTSKDRRPQRRLSGPMSGVWTWSPHPAVDDSDSYYQVIDAIDKVENSPVAMDMAAGPSGHTTLGVLRRTY